MNALRTILEDAVSNRTEDSLVKQLVRTPVLIKPLVDFLFPDGSRLYVPFGDFAMTLLSAALMSGRQSIVLPDGAGGSPIPSPDGIVMVKGILDNDFDPYREWIKLLPFLSLEKKDFKKVEVRAVLDNRTLRPPSESSLEATQFVRIESLL